MQLKRLPLLFSSAQLRRFTVVKPQLQYKAPKTGVPSNLQAAVDRAETVLPSSGEVWPLGAPQVRGDGGGVVHTSGPTHRR